MLPSQSIVCKFRVASVSILSSILALFCSVCEKFNSEQLPPSLKWQLTHLESPLFPWVFILAWIFSFLKCTDGASLCACGRFRSKRLPFYPFAIKYVMLHWRWQKFGEEREREKEKSGKWHKEKFPLPFVWFVKQNETFPVHASCDIFTRVELKREKERKRATGWKEWKANMSEA